MIYSIEVEKHVLRGLIKYPDLFAEIESFVSEMDFGNDLLATAFCLLRDAAREQKKLDKVLLVEKIKNLGIKYKDNTDPETMIDGLSFSQITFKAALDAARELVKVRIRRELFNTGEEIKNLAKVSGNREIDEVIGEADSIYHKKILSYEQNDEPINIFADAEKIVEERGNNPVDEVGLITPYPEFNRLYGGLKHGNIYSFAARPACGKSSLLNDLCFKISLNSGFKVKTLFLDTEMSSEDVRWRMISALTGVGMWYLETGNWRKSQELVSKVRPALKLMENYKYFHYPVGNKNTQQVCALVRRWRFKNLKRTQELNQEEEKFLISYDYLKMTGEKISQNFAEHQVLGEKIDSFKKLSEEVKAPFNTAIQANRTGDTFNKKSNDIIDDSTAIAQSDRLMWYGTFVSILRLKSPDEIQEDGVEFGTHKLIKLKSRFQGKDAPGHQDCFLRTYKNGEERWINNFLNFDITNFNVQEKGSVRDIIKKNNNQLHLHPTPNNSDGTLM